MIILIWIALLVEKGETRTQVIRVDSASEYVAIPGRGIVFSRKGTVLSQMQQNVMTAIVTLNPPEFLWNSEVVLPCGTMLMPVLADFEEHIKRYKTMTEAIFQAKHIFTTEEISNIVQKGNSSAHAGNGKSLKRDKRLIALGAYALAGSALALSLTSMGMSTANMIEIDKINNYVKNNEDLILQLQADLLVKQKRSEVIIDTQHSILGYLQNITIAVNDINEHVKCVQRLVTFSITLTELRSKIENLIQFIFLGKTHGQLNPLLIDPDMLKRFIRAESNINSRILGEYPNMMYQTTIASLIQADFENFQFTFLLTYPDFDQNPIYPFYVASQIGFLAKTPDLKKTECLMFSMPTEAVVFNNTLFALKNPLSCPSFGNVMICYNRQLELYPMEHCLRVSTEGFINGTTEEQVNCPMFRCFGDQQQTDAYTSTKGGILVRTTANTIRVAYSQPKQQLDLYHSAEIENVQVDPSGAVFIPWRKNVSYVSFNDHVIYSPVNRENYARIEVSLSNAMATLDSSAFLSIPHIGTQAISKLFENQQSRLNELELRLEPSSIKKALSPFDFELPFWFKIVFWGVVGIVIFIVLKYLYTRKLCRQCQPCSYNPPRNVRSNAIPLYEPVAVQVPNAPPTAPLDYCTNHLYDHTIRPH